jgi:signal peptidase I
VGVFGFALCLAFVAVARTHFRLALVVGTSMQPGLGTGDVLLVDKLAYRKAEPLRGDIVLARYDNEMIVKRIVGFPGEEVSVRRGRVFVNGGSLIESHLIIPGPLEITPGRLLPGRFALLGDNREVGAYQPIHAIVAKNDIVGRVVCSFHVHHLLAVLG